MTMRAAKRAGLVLACVAGIGGIAPAAAQDAPQPWDFKWDNGFKLSSPDKSFKLQLGGRIMADYTFAADVGEALPEVEDGFEFRRARLFFSGTVYDRVEFKAQYDFAGGEAAAKDLYIGIVNDWGRLRFGHFHEPFSLEEITSSKYITFAERSLPVEAFAPSRNAGVGALGSVGTTVNWGVGAYYDTDDFGESIDENATDLTARLGWRPLFEDGGKRVIHVGAAVSSQDRDGSMRYRARPEAHLAPRFVDTGSFDGDGALLLGGEVAGVFGPFWFAGEVMQSDVDAPGLGDPTLGGFYAAAGWFLTGESRKFEGDDGVWGRTKPRTNFGDEGMGGWEIAIRFSSLDLSDAGLNGGEQDDVTLGVNWYLNPVTRLGVSWVHADVEGKDTADLVVARWQIDF